MTSAEVSDFSWLVSPQAQPWLTAAAAWTDALPTQAKRLRRALSLARTHLVLEQVELRRRAAAKFSCAPCMFFTRRALEQATSERVAAWKAERYAMVRERASADAGKAVADLCCGVGGDLLALAERGPAFGVDRDEVATILARANLAACGRSHAQVRCGDVRDIVGQIGSAWHLDPDRRAAQGRVAQPEFAEPGCEFWERLLAAHPTGAIKLAPAARLPPPWAARCELEWIGENGECKQQVAWFGELARSPGRRSATVLSPDSPPRVIAGLATRPPVARGLGRFLYEPDAAVLAADLSGALAAAHGLEALSHGIAYLTGDARVDDIALAGYEVLESLPFDRKRLKALLRERGIGRLEIKKRGVEVEPSRLLRELTNPGDRLGTVLLTPLGGKTVAILARRIAVEHAVIATPTAPA